MEKNGVKWSSWKSWFSTGEGEGGGSRPINKWYTGRLVLIDKCTKCCARKKEWMTTCSARSQEHLHSFMGLTVRWEDRGLEKGISGNTCKDHSGLKEYRMFRGWRGAQWDLQVGCVWGKPRSEAGKMSNRLGKTLHFELRISDFLLQWMIY